MSGSRKEEPDSDGTPQDFSSRASKFTMPEFRIQGGNNPINGTDCFFSEATFQRVVGSELSFRERFMIHLARAKSMGKEKVVKEKHVDLDKPSQPRMESNAVSHRGTKSDENELSIIQSVTKVPAKSDDSHLQEDSTDDEESKLTLVIADGTENSKNESVTEKKTSMKEDLEKPNDTAEPIDGSSKEVIQGTNISEACDDPSDPVIPTNHETEKQDNIGKQDGHSGTDKSSIKLSGSLPSYALEAIPSYTAGITGKPIQSSGLSSETARNVEIDEAENNYQKQAKTANKGSISTAVLDQEMCLVMPSLHSDSESDMERNTTPIETSGSNLPLIPALMTGDRKIVTKPGKAVLETNTKQEIIKNDSQTEEESRLVMAASSSDTGHNLSGPSSLPLIPALIASPVKVKREKASQQISENAISTPSVSSLFYYGNLGTDTCVFTPTTKTPEELITEPTDVENGQDKVSHEQEGDVPIFSLMSDSAETGIRRSTRNKGIWSNELTNSEEKSVKGSLKRDDSVKQAMHFRQSDFTRDEMAKYLRLFKKYVKPYLYGGTPVLTEQQKREQEEFEVLQQRAEKEQREFQGYLHKNAMKNPLFYSNIKPEAKYYAMIKARSYRPKKKFLKSFSHGFISKVPFGPNTRHVQLLFQKSLVEVGSSPKIVLPEIKSGNHPVPIPFDIKRLEDNFPRDAKNHAPGFVHHESVGNDINAQTLAEKYGADVVLSSSVVKCLMNNREPDFARGWNIPAIIKEHEKDGITQKVVYLQKPLFEDQLVLRDYNALFHKYMFRVMISHPKHTQSLSTKRQSRQTQMTSGVKKSKVSDDPFDTFGADLDVLETFGQAAAMSSTLESESQGGEENDDFSSGQRRSKRIAASPKAKPNRQNKLKPTKETMQPSGSGNTSNPKMDTTPEKSPGNTDREASLDPEGRKGSLRKRSLKMTSQGEEEEESQLACDVASPLTNTGTDAGSESVLKEELLSPPRCKHQKKVLSLSPKSSIARSKQQFSFPGASQGLGSNLLDLILGPQADKSSKREPSVQENPNDYAPHTEELSSLTYNLWTLGQFKAIVRTRSHGTHKNKNVYVKAKLEYQPSHGFEQVTAEETVRDWTSCYIRPGTRLLRARINAFSSEILLYEELESHQILKPTSGFRPEEGFSLIHNLVTHLSSLDPGMYMLSHDAGANFCGVRIFKQGAKVEDHDDSPVQLPKKHPHTKPDQVPWIPIDTNLLLPYHVLNQRIPATFLPKDVVPGQGKKPAKQQTQQSEIGKKKKKKKKNNKFKGFQQKKNKDHLRDFF